MLDDAAKRLATGRAEPFEAGQLRLDGDAGRPGGIDQRAAVCLNRAGSFTSDARSLRRFQRLRPKFRGIGIEPEHDLRLPLLNCR